jgi:molybdenum cofactor synthesis domain-containing protein
MKTIETKDAVGRVLAHDMTQIIPGEFKGEPFKKGHVVTQEDIPVLLSMGKEHIYILEDGDENLVHENDAATFLYSIVADENMQASEISAGKINANAKVQGILRVDKQRLFELNSLSDVTVSVRHDYSLVREGDLLFSTRVTPLFVDKTVLDDAAEIASGAPVVCIEPILKRKIGVVTTGREVYDGLIKDGFLPILTEKISELGAELIGQTLVPDEPELTTKAIEGFIEKGADVVLVTGGMSVDPDDLTPLAIKNTGAEIITYGSPMFPGAMMMLAYIGVDLGAESRYIAIMGIPGGMLHSKRTAFDVVFPRVLTGRTVSREEINRAGNGGLCLNCKTCIFPNCGFGVE